MGLKMSSDFNKENQESEVKTNTTSSNGGLKMNGFSDSAPSVPDCHPEEPRKA